MAVIRGILGVIAGYAVIVVWTMVVFTALWFVMGVDRVYPEGTLEVSTGWTVMALVTGFIGALLGGLVCALVAGGLGAVRVFAAIVLVLGLVLAVMQLRTEPATGPSKPLEEMSVFEAASESVAPSWYNFTIPFVGAVGVLIGGRLRPRGGAAATTV